MTKAQFRQDSIAFLMNNLDPELLEFIHEYVRSFVQWDLLHFFYTNPHTLDTASQIARYIGRDLPVVEVELDRLVKTDILLRENLQELVIYTLTENPVLRHKLRAFIEACQDRQFYLKAIYHVIRGLRR